MPLEADIRRATNDLIQQRLYHEALLYLEEASAGNGKLRPFIEYLRGQVYIAMRDFVRARKHYEISFQNDYRIESAEMIATLLMAEGKLENAIEFLEHTIAGENENLRMLKFDLCKFYAISDRFQEADRIMGEILPGLAPPLPDQLTSEALMLKTAIIAEFENLDKFPNIKAFFSMVERVSLPHQKKTKDGKKKGADGPDESSP